MTRCAQLLALLVFLPAVALAQGRTIPGDAKSGKIRHVEEMVVEINGKRTPLAPGAQIRGTNNLFIVPTAIPAGAPAKYTLDGDGRVRQVWLLTPEEAKKR